MFSRRTEADLEAQEKLVPSAESLQYCVLEGGPCKNGAGPGLQRTTSELKISFRGKCKQGRALRVLVCLLAFVALDLLGVAVFSAVIRHANQLGRSCIAPDVLGVEGFLPRGTRFAILTASDNNNTFHKRPFQGVSDVISPNKAAYAEMHGYSFIDASNLLDSSRPPSWSKIVAMKRHMADFDWLLWTDADSLVTNFNIRLDALVNQMLREGDFKEGDMPDLIATEDATGINAGMFFMRNSQWSRDFLDRWWGQTDFILPRGLCRSGDNDALKHLMRTMPQVEKRQHVLMAKRQCSFNSNLWVPTPRNHLRLYHKFGRLWDGTYSKGDFVVHLAGLNDKKKYALGVLESLGQKSFE